MVCCYCAIGFINGRLFSTAVTAQQRSMSWLQSSLGFAKTAISQAQKSIDKVLDIKDEHDVLSPGRSYTGSHQSLILCALATVRRVASFARMRGLTIFCSSPVIVHGRTYCSTIAL